MLPTGAAAVPLLGPPPRGPPLMRRRPNPRIELVPEPEPEPDPEPQPEQISGLARWVQFCLRRKLPAPGTKGGLFCICVESREPDLT